MAKNIGLGLSPESFVSVEFQVGLSTRSHIVGPGSRSRLGSRIQGRDQVSDQGPILGLGRGLSPDLGLGLGLASLIRVGFRVGVRVLS
ncbi:hypothetical protein HAX54_021242 [Datura stramonium]|uniref:Uncharacterized protein n=1 Tax=Datura stramonium TaxID=4076 RepID=A0ABS8USL8_DATST|nr:hypothetical protein [Datura stramonium]